MKLLLGSQHTPSKDLVLTIGNFDGVHLGHQALLAKLKEVASLKQLPSAILLFEPQPGEFFKGIAAPARLYSLREKLQTLKQYDIDRVYCLSFNASLANMSPHAFAEKIIFSSLNAKYILVGEDFRFGFNRNGDISLLKTLSEKKQCEVQAYPDFLLRGARVSSTQIRQLLLQGQLEQAQVLLGKPYSMYARVITGDQRGRKMGFPTANLNIRRLSLPISGVFCVQLQRQDGSKLEGVANIGTRPTVGGIKPVLEVHIFDFSEIIYGEFLQVFFLHKLRNEVRFLCLEELVEQIHKDVENAKTYFRKKPSISIE